MFPMITRTDENFNVVWSALFDISSTAIDTVKTLTEDDVVYAATLNTLNYGCIIALNFEAGSNILSQCYQYLPIFDANYNDINNILSDLVSFNETYFIMDFASGETVYLLFAFVSKANLQIRKLFNRPGSFKYQTYYISEKYQSYLRIYFSSINNKYATVDIDFDDLNIQQKSLLGRTFPTEVAFMNPASIIKNPTNSTN